MEQRFGALALDSLFMLALIIIAALACLLAGVDGDLAMTVMGLASFTITTFYFMWFELAWQGRTPGKRILGLRVVARDGGELTATSIVARNLTREVELFLPLGLAFRAMILGGPDNSLAFFGWMTVLAAFPIFSGKRLRAGDLIGGTMVITMPKRALPVDLTTVRGPEPAYVFTDRQLGIYGNLELQALEELLRQAETAAPGSAAYPLMAMGVVADKIRRKIGWPPPPVRGDDYRFLKAFYLAEREVLEKNLILGRRKESKLDPVTPVGPRTPPRG